jgi:acetyltransferase-like isoleucine patch superfamily enzyme
MDDDLIVRHRVDSPELRSDVLSTSVRDHVWPPLRFIILPGVTLGAAAVIDAEFVTSRDIPPYLCSRGSPAASGAGDLSILGVAYRAGGNHG